MKLTEHFTLEELYQSDYAIRHGIINKPSPNIIGNLLVTAQGLEKVREILGNKAITVNSGYRCPKLNEALNGSKTSAHMDGYAADFTCHAYGKPQDIVLAISKSKLEFDQCIQEGTWVHISFAPAMRKEFLTAIFDNKGKVTYLKGVA